jgi:hypothetical protein
MNAWRKEAMACQGKTEARLEGEELTSVEMKSEVAHQMVLRKYAAVMPVRGRKKRHRGWNQAAGQRGEPKKLNRGNWGSQRKLAAACMKVSLHSTVAWRKRNVFGKFLTQSNYGLPQELAASRK